MYYYIRASVLIWALATSFAVGIILGVYSERTSAQLAEKSTGTTGYYSSPQVTRPAASVGGYPLCPRVFKKKDGTYYAKVTVCYRA